MKYVLAAGGSGGHLIPALRVGAVLLARGHSVSYMGSSFSSGGTLTGIEIFDHGAVGWAGKRGMAKVRAFIKMGRAVFRCQRQLQNLKSDAVCGFGGFGAFPAVYAASRMRIPTMMHEQNLIPGQANRWLAKHVDKIALSFEDSREFFSEDKSVVTGCPCHYNGDFVDKMESYKTFGLSPHRFTVLVLGGSQGSQALNQIVPQALVDLSSRMDLQCIHCAGNSDATRVQAVYAAAGLPNAVFTFFQEMAKAYTVADLVISRSGALTVSEIMAYQRRAILVPYPYAQAHQLANARWLQDKGLARICLQKDLTVEKVKEFVLITRSEALVSGGMSVSGVKFLPEHAIADCLEKIVG